MNRTGVLLITKFSISSLLLGFWLFFFPESPKFLIECGETVEALEVLKDIFQVNSGNDRSLYPVSPALIIVENEVKLIVFFLVLDNFVARKGENQCHITQNIEISACVKYAKTEGNEVTVIGNLAANKTVVQTSTLTEHYTYLLNTVRFDHKVKNYFQIQKYLCAGCLKEEKYFILFISYYTLMIWFPELFYRFEEFEGAHPGQHASVCEVSSIVLTNG